MAYFDRDKLDKIVSNLLSNACKYTANGGDIKLIVDSYWESEYHIYEYRSLIPEKVLLLLIWRMFSKDFIQ